MNKGWTLVAYEITGAMLAALIILVFHLDINYYFSLLFAIPFGVSLDLIGSLTITRFLKKIKFDFNINKELEGKFKNYKKKDEFFANSKYRKILFNNYNNFLNCNDMTIT